MNANDNLHILHCSVQFLILKFNAYANLIQIFHLIIMQKISIRNTPLEDQKPFHKCTFAECLHPSAAACQGEQKESLYGKLSLQH